MALGGIAYGWDNSKPGANDQAGNGDDEIRSLRSNLQGALDSEHNFANGGLSSGGGAHRLGSARAFYGAESTVSSSDTMGRLMVSSDRSRLFHVGSNGTMLLGAATILSIASGFLLQTPPQTHYWALEDLVITNTILSNGSIGFPFYSSFSGKPLVFAVPYLGSALHPVVIATNASNATCYFYDSSDSLVANATTAHVISIGSRLLG